MTGDAVVMAADSEEISGDYAKSSMQKIRLTDYLGNWRLAIGGAGNGTYIDLFEQMLSRRLFVFQKFDFDKIVSVIRATLHEVHKKHIWPRHGDQRVSFQAIIGIQSHGENKGRGLFYTEDSALLRIDGSKGYQTIGVGCYLAEYLIHHSIPQYGGIYSMPTEQVMNLSAYVLARVKSLDRGIQGVAGPTYVLVLYGNGGVRWMDEREIARVEQWLDAYNRIQLPVMLALANPRISDDAFDRIATTFSIDLANLRQLQKANVREWEAQIKAWEEQIRKRAEENKRQSQTVTQSDSQTSKD
jgi:hypothetical protein